MASEKILHSIGEFRKTNSHFLFSSPYFCPQNITLKTYFKFPFTNPVKSQLIVSAAQERRDTRSMVRETEQDK